MSFRTLKARPKPNLDFTNKRRALTDKKVNEEIKSKTESSSESSETSGGGGSTSLPIPVNETNCGDNEEKSSPTPSSLPPNEEVTASITKTSSIPLTKLKPRPRPNLAQGNRPNNVTVPPKDSTSTKHDPEDCVIVGVLYSNGDVSQESKVTSSSASVADDAVNLPPSTDIQQRNITAKLKARPIPNLISLNRSKRPLPPPESIPIAKDNSSEQVKDLIKNSETFSSSPQVTSTSKEGNTEGDELKAVSPPIEDKTTNNINLIGAKQESRRSIKKKPKKDRKKKQFKLNTRLLPVKGKVRYVVRALEFLEKITAKKKKKQITLEQESKQVCNSSDFRRKNILIKKEINHTKKILEMTKKNLKRSTKCRQLKDDLMYNKLLGIVSKEIKMAKKPITIPSKVKKETSLKKQKEALIERHKSLVNTDDKQIEECKAQANKVNDSNESTDFKRKLLDKCKTQANKVIDSNEITDLKNKQIEEGKSQENKVNESTDFEDKLTKECKAQASKVIDSNEITDFKDKQIEECTSQANKVNEITVFKDKQTEECKAQANKNTKKVQKIRCKINPMITKPSGVKSMRIKIFKDDGTCVKSASEMCSDKESATSESGKESSLPPSPRPSKDINKSQTNHSRRFNINTVKPNLATANRNYKPIQYTTSYGKLNNAVKQKFKDKFGSKKPPEHSKLTMLDLIFYNPSSNPMSEKEKKKDLSSEPEISNEEANQSIKNEEQSVNEDKESREEANDEEDQNESSLAVDTNGLPVPQLKITADGKVIIAPESLIVPGKNDDVNKNESRPLIVENDLTHHKVFNKKAKLEKKVWSFQETLKFYKVLNETGSDFLSMASHFPDRTRNCLKRKFKREEKLNGQLIDKVIGSRRIDFSHVEKELALNQMWDEVEKSCKRRSKYMPEIPDVNKGNISEMFLTKREREMKATNSDDANGANAALNEHNASKQSKQERGRKQTNNNKKKKKKPKVLRLKDYLSDNNNGSNGGGTNGNTKNTLHINLKCLEEPESTNVSSDDEERVKDEEENRTSIPIVVNTSIESSGIKYTKSVTFNPGNMELPLDINETIAHTGGNEHPGPSSTEIIKQIVDILSTDETPSILSADKTLSTTIEHVSENDQHTTESGNVCQQSIINDNSDNQ